MHSWMDEARRALAADEAVPLGVKSVHVFGSALRSSDPEDVDLLVVYDPSVVAPRDASRLREAVISILGPLTGPPIQIVLLTCEEQQSTRFAESEGADLLFARHRPLDETQPVDIA